ncbi:hypothetical protein [uncultured Enterovirga sp.]|uniref:hypothetical protein n=1 Tax=uncultured Enterovirga sp. TaxID=2026352 RepID=UPI0035CB2456
MSSAPPDFAHLATLIESAKAEAKRIGSSAAEVARSLEAAAAAARSATAQGGRPDEGIPPDELTTDNDK